MGIFSSNKTDDNLNKRYQNGMIYLMDCVCFQNILNLNYPEQTLIYGINSIGGRSFEKSKYFAVFYPFI